MTIEDIAKFTQHMGETAEAFELEIRKKAKSLAYDHVTIGDGENSFTVNISNDQSTD